MNAKQLRKAAFDMSWMQITWAIWFIAIALLVYLAAPLFGVNVQTHNQLSELVDRIVNWNWEQETDRANPFGYISFLSHPSKIFMLVCGIISVSGFMSYFVKHGVTRKTYFYSTIVSAACLSVMLVLTAGLIYAVEAVMLGSEYGLTAAWIAAMFVQGLLNFFYYLLGWVIGANFYRSGELGLLSILLAIAFAFAIEGLLSGAFTDKLNLPDNLAPLVSLAGTVLLIAAALWIIRIATKDASIKIK